MSIKEIIMNIEQRIKQFFVAAVENSIRSAWNTLYEDNAVY